MNVVIGLIIFSVGIVAGFLANRYLSSSSKENQKLAEQVKKTEAALSQYKLDVAEHLESSATLLEKMNDTCQTAMKQMTESTRLLQQATPTDINAMPFFSKETQDHLAQTVSVRRKKESERVKAEQLTEAPRDYSSNPSGLFADKKQSVTNDK